MGFDHVVWSWFNLGLVFVELDCVWPGCCCKQEEQLVLRGGHVDGKRLSFPATGPG